MAQLKDTTINGGLTVKGGSQGVELFGSTPYVDFHYNNYSGDYTSRIEESSSGILNVKATDFRLNGDSLGKPNRLFHESSGTDVVNVVSDSDSSGTYYYLRPNVNIQSVSRLGSNTNPWNMIYGEGGKFTSTVNALRFITNNGYGFDSYASDKTTRKSLIYLSSSNHINVGAESGSTAHTGNVYINSSAGNVSLYNSAGYVVWDKSTSSADGYAGLFRPSTDNKALLGTTSCRWKRVTAGTSTIATSDEREKSEITPIADYPVTFSRNGSGNIFEQLFDKLNPTTYYFNDDEKPELHIGFIAQDIVRAAEELGISEDDLAFIDHGFWTDEETGEERDRYGLAYEEFIALNTYIIQKQKQEIELLKEEVNNLKEMIEGGR